MTDAIEANGRTYARPAVPTVGICIDGNEPAYLEAAAGVMPNLEAIRQRGAEGLVRTVVPSFTNPNNVAIVTGTPPAVNGIPGNYYYDGEAEVMMNDPRYLRAPTLLAAFGRADCRVAAVTAKDKLRRLLGHGLDGICFSVECAQEATRDEHGIDGVLDLVGRPNPGIYDPEASVWCIEAGARLLEKVRPDLMYLSTTDFVQHKWAPGEDEANAFYAGLDRFIGELDRMGAVLGIVADHGMNAKTRADGSPNVQYLESALVEAGVPEARVILPITDPYVVHHGALGSYATVYTDADHVDKAAAVLTAIPGVEAVHRRDEAARAYDLPPDRIGDLVVLSDRGTVLGRTPEWHDLKEVQSGLRSHGGLHEATVPMLFNRPLRADHARRLAAGEARNYDLFDFLCNGIDSTA